MPSLAIDSERTTMIATGHVTPVTAWTAEGKRTDEPKRDPSTGMPLWLIDCLVDDPDATRSVVAGVEVGSLDLPIIRKLVPVTFTGLTVNCYVQRSSGSLVMRWSAAGFSQDTSSRSLASAS